jgi:hypothetical protein
MPTTVRLLSPAGDEVLSLQSRDQAAYLTD